MTPLIALNSDKNVRLVCGSSGGTRIITSTALVKNIFYKSICLIFIIIFNFKTAARNLIRGQDLLSSVDEARLHQQLRPDEVLYENHLDEVFKNFSFILIEQFITETFLECAK